MYKVRTYEDLKKDPSIIIVDFHGSIAYIKHKSLPGRILSENMSALGRNTDNIKELPIWAYNTVNTVFETKVSHSPTTYYEKNSQHKYENKYHDIDSAGTEDGLPPLTGRRMLPPLDEEI